MSPINPQNVENPEAHIMQEPLSKAYVYVCVCVWERESELERFWESEVEISRQSEGHSGLDRWAQREYRSAVE